MEEKIFLRVPYETVRFASPANAMGVSLLVGQTGWSNFRCDV